MFRRPGRGYDAPVLRSRLVLPPEERAEWRHPTRSLGGRLALGGLAALAVAIPFTLLALLVLSEWGPLARLDAHVANDLNAYALARPYLVDVLHIASVVFDPWVFRLVVAVVAGWLWTRGAKRLAVWAVTTTVIGGVLGVVLKLIVSRARPAFDEPVAHAGGYSFPSGHALNSFLCTAVLILVFLPVLSRAGRMLAYALGAAVVLLTGFDRIALGVHYVSDVLAGWIVALAVLAGTARAFEVWRREHGPAGIEPGRRSRSRGSRRDVRPTQRKVRLVLPTAARSTRRLPKVGSAIVTRVARIAGKVLICLAVVYAVLVGIGLLLTKALDGTGFVRAEDHINTGLADHRDKPLNDLTYLLSGLGNTAAIIGAMVVVAIAMRFALKRWRESVFLVLAVSAQALVFFCVQLTVTRQRPDVKRLDSSPPTSSFPSGHTGAATALYVASALLILWYVHRRWVKFLSVTVLLAVPLLVAYGRLYRGMHHPTRRRCRDPQRARVRRHRQPVRAQPPGVG